MKWKRRWILKTQKIKNDSTICAGLLPTAQRIRSYLDDSQIIVVLCAVFSLLWPECYSSWFSPLICNFNFDPITIEKISSSCMYVWHGTIVYMVYEACIRPPANNWWIRNKSENDFRSRNLLEHRPSWTLTIVLRSIWFGASVATANGRKW